jgi:PAS domain S-box-containing protein
MIDPALQQIVSHAIHQVKEFSISLLSVQGIFVFWNVGAKLLDGYEPEEIVGKPLDILHPGLEKMSNLTDYLFNTAGNEGSVKNIGRRLKKDGTVYMASVVLNSVFDKAGNHVGYLRIARELKGNEIE